MKITEKQTKEVDVLTDVICDCCGNSCKFFMFSDDEVATYEYMSLEAAWGYGSNKDGEKMTAQVCEKCVDEKFSFLKFKKTNYIP